MITLRVEICLRHNVYSPGPTIISSENVVVGFPPKRLRKNAILYRWSVTFMCKSVLLFAQFKKKASAFKSYVNFSL